jgi:serine protein kinase
MLPQQEIQSLIDRYTQESAYQALHWEGAFADYLKIVNENPGILRDAFQRIYDLIISYGTEEYVENKDKLTRYRFFSDPDNGGVDAVFGLERPLMHLVNVFKSASRHYGTERRILLLHGPVGSAKSTIVRLLKKGLETYSRKPEGAVYSFSWHFPDPEKGQINEPCPMHEDPLNLLPSAVREPLIQSLNTKINGRTKIAVDGDLCPSCRFYYRTLMQRYAGDLKKVLDHVQVYRLILSEQDRIGIGTFQPKDLH